MTEPTFTAFEYPDCQPAPPKGGALLKFILIAPLSLAAFAGGTGGAYSPEIFDQIQDSTPLVEVYENRGDEYKYALKAGQLLSNIREVFGLKMSDMAQTFGVSRTAVYDWLAGTTPKPEISKRIWEISRYADELKSAGIDRIEHFARRPIVQGRSFVELLKSGENIQEALTIIRQTAVQEALIRKSAPNRHFSSRKRGVTAGEEISNPITFDRG